MLIILLVGAAASKLDDLTSRESFTVGELRRIRHECKGAIPRARRDDAAAAAAAARTYFPESWPRQSCVPVAIRRWACGLPAKRRRDTADNTVAKTYRKLLRWLYEETLATTPSRAIAAGLNDWEWQPRNASCAAEDWLGDDRRACGAMIRATPQDRRIALHARHAALRAAGNRTGWGDGRDGLATLRWAGALAPLAGRARHGVDLRVDRGGPRGARFLRRNRRHGGVVGFEIDLPPDRRKHRKNPAPRVSGSAVRRAGRRLVNTLSTLKAFSSSAARASPHHHSRRARSQQKRPPG